MQSPRLQDLVSDPVVTQSLNELRHCTDLLIEHQIFHCQQGIDCGGIGHRFDGDIAKFHSTFGDIQPLLSTALVLLRPNSRSLQVFHLGIWGLATILGLFWSVMVLSNTHMHKWSLWGVWIYLVLAVSMLVLEGFALTAKKEPPMDWKAEYNV